MAEFDDTFEDFEMVPSDVVDSVDAETELQAAVASVLEDPDNVQPELEPSIPYGRTWKFDHERGRFARIGGAPGEVQGVTALRVWLETTLHTALGAHPGFERVGLEDPDDWIGGVDPTPALATFQRRFRDAAREHDRVEDVTDVHLEHDPDEGIIYLRALTITTDEGAAIQLTDLVAAPEI